MEKMTFDETYPQIVGLVADVLGMPPENVTKTNNFFGLGGTSAQALTLCLRIEQMLPQLFDVDGIDMALIATQPDLEHFARALVTHSPVSELTEGEL
jgi:hypothetical protein